MQEPTSEVATETALDVQRTWRIRLGRAGLTLLGVAIFGILVYVGGWESLHKVARPNLFWLAGVVACVALTLFIFSARWGVLANGLAGRRVASTFDLYFYAVSSLALGILVPQTASVVVVRSVALNRLVRISLQRSIASVLLDKLFDAFFMLLFAWPAMLLSLKLVTLPQVVLISLLEFGVVSALIVGRYTLWLRLMQRLVSLAVVLLGRVPFLKGIERRKAVERLEHLEEWDVLQRRTVLWAYWLTVAGQVMMALRSWMIAQAVELAITPWAAFVGVALAQASLLIAITPGGMGIVEGAWYIVLAGADIPTDTVAAFLVAHRVFRSMAVALTWLVMHLLRLINNRLGVTRPGYANQNLGEASGE